MLSKTRIVSIFFSKLKYSNLANFSNKAINQKPRKLGLIGMRGNRRTINKDFEIKYTDEKLLNEEEYNVKPDQIIDLKSKEVTQEEYVELVHEFESLMNIYNNDNLYKSKKKLEELFYKVKEKNLLKCELTCLILEITAETNIKLRLYDEADACFDNMSTIFSNNSIEFFQSQEQDPFEQQERANEFKARAAYNSALIKCLTSPSAGGQIINEKLLTDSYFRYLPDTHKGQAEFEAVTETLYAMFCYKFMMVNKNDYDDSSNPVLLIKSSMDSMYRFGSHTWNRIIMPAYYNNFALTLYFNATINNMNIDKILDREIYLMQSGTIQSETMDEISIDQVVKSNFIITPIIKALSARFEIEFHKQQTLHQIANAFANEVDDNQYFWETLDKQFITMVSNLAYILFQSNKKEHRNIGLKFLNIANILCNKVNYNKKENPFIETFVRFLYAIYFIDTGKISSAEKIINEIVSNEQLDYKCDSVKHFGLQLLASGMKGSKDFNYSEILNDKAKKMEKERTISLTAFETNLFQFEDYQYLAKEY